MPEQIQSIISNLRGFGVKRLAMLAGIAVLVMGVIGIASVYLNRPAYDTLYVGLERSDVNQMVVFAEAEAGGVFGVDALAVQVLPVEMIGEKYSDLDVAVPGEHVRIAAGIFREEVSSENVGGALDPLTV